MRKLDEFDIAKVVASLWDSNDYVGNEHFNATNDVLSGAYLWGVDAVSIIGALSSIGRPEITAEVMDELRRRGFQFDTEEEL